MFFQDANELTSKEALSRLFREADVDNSGSITFEEFVACCMAFTLGTSQLQSILNPVTTRKSVRTTLEPSAYLGIQLQKALGSVDEKPDLEDEEEEEEACQRTWRTWTQRSSKGD